MSGSNNFLTVLADPKDPQIEVVAVHGLNYTDREKHAELTWTAPNGKMWLKDLEFLPKKLSNARILLFGYNANVAFRASTAGVDQQAENLLNRLHLLRKRKAMNLPIIFICYSLGGIIVKRALVIAKNDNTYASIDQLSYGLVFFGTPHQGGNFKNLGEIAESIARISLKYPGNTFVEALTKDSLFADAMVKDFRHQLEDRWVVTFYETHPINENLGIIVDRKSATLGLPGPREIQVALDTDHENLCKFEDCKGHDYEQVGDNIRDLAEKVMVIALELSPENTMEPRGRSTPQPPGISKLPDLLHQHFTGRVDQLQQIQEMLTASGSKPKRVSIYGMPGVGKSQLALKFAQHNQHIYRNVFHVQATDETQLIRDFNIIHGLLRLQKRLPDEQELKNQDILQWFTCNRDDGDWLAIFDNVLDVNITKKFLPASNTGAVLFTMRSERIAKELGSAGRLELLSMEEAESVELILKITEHPNLLGPEREEHVEIAKKIHRELGGLPLALAQGVTFSKDNYWTIDQYLGRLQGAAKIETLKKETLLGNDIALYSNCYSTFSIAVQSITPTAVMLLKFISHFDHKDVPLQLFEIGRPKLSGFLDSLSFKDWPNRLKSKIRGNDEYKGSRSVVKGYDCDDTLKSIRKLFFTGNELEKALTCLQASALVRRKDQGNIWIHDLFCDLSQDLVSLSEKKLIIASTIILAKSTFLNPQIQENMSTRESIGSHLAKSLNHTQHQKLELWVVYQTNHLLGSYYYERGQYLESMCYYQRALAGFENTLGKNHYDTLSTVHSMAGVFNSRGEYDKALGWCQRALAGFEKAQGKEHPDTLSAVHNMASVFSNRGEYDKALEWCQRALAGLEKALGKEHPYTLNTVHNMAMVFRERGEYDKALEWYQRALAGREKALGRGHPKTVKSALSVSELYTEKRCFEEATAIRQRFNLPPLSLSAA